MGTVRKILLYHTMIAKVVLTLTTAGLAAAAPQLFDSPVPSRTRVNQNQVVTSVISTLQPAIAAAVAQALRGSSLGSSGASRPSGGSGNAFTGSNATPAQYSYEDPTGAIVTVKYTAGELGFQESRERQEGAVTIKAQPLSATGSAGPSSTAGLDIDRLIAQVIAAL